MANLIRLAAALTLIIGAAALVCGQDAPKRCKAEKVQGAPKYRIGTAYRTVESEPTQVIFISVEPEHFNRAEMLALAEQLKRDFCTEPRLEIVIFSNHEAAKYFVPNDYSPKIYWDAMRGGYQLDRNTGEESVSFSPDASRPRAEMKILLSSKTSP